MLDYLSEWWRSRSPAKAQAMLEAEMEEEMRFHMAMEERHLASSGVPSDQAKRRARLLFGAEEGFKDEIRQAMPLRWLTELRADVAYAMRSLRRSPGFTTFAVLALAIGIGANAAAFGFADPVAFRKLAVDNPERLVAVFTTQPDEKPASVPSEGFQTLRSMRAFQDVAAFTEHPVAITIDGIPSVAYAVHSSANYFSVLGLAAERGRLFRPGDQGHETAVIGHAFWKSAFKGDPRIVGRRVTVNGTSFKIIGVAPESFHGTRLFTYEPALWLPVESPARGSFNVIARLASNATLSDAQDQAGSRYTVLRNESPINPWLASRDRIELLGRLCLAGVCIVLLVACADVANLLLTRVSVRRQEITTRIALGVSAGRLARQLLAESFVLVFLGALVSVPLAFIALKASRLLTPPLDFPISFQPSVDRRVIIFTISISLVSAVVFGMAPLVQLWWRELNPDRHNSLRAAGGLGSGFRSALVVMQVALSVVAIAAAGLLYRGFDTARAIELGFDTDNAVVFSLDPFAGATFDASRAREIDGRLKTALAELPGVTSVSFASSIPLDGETRTLRVLSANGGQREVVADYFITDEDYFEALGIKLSDGRSFTRDESTLETVVINETLARRMFGEKSPIGQQVRLASGSERFAVVSGVARFVASRRLGDPDRPIIWRSTQRLLLSRRSVIVRSTRDRADLERDITRAVHSVDPATPVLGLRSLEDRVALAYTGARTGAVLGLIFGALTAILAAFGLFGVLLYNITQRTREIGIRRALGASSGDVLKVVTAHSVRLTLIGTAIGVTTILLIPKRMSAILYGVSPHDPTLLVATPIAFLLLAILATIGPAWKAIRIEPIEALRVE